MHLHDSDHRIASALIATLIGTAASLGIQAMKPKMRTFMMGVTNIPMLTQIS